MAKNEQDLEYRATIPHHENELMKLEISSSKHHEQTMIDIEVPDGGGLDGRSSRITLTLEEVRSIVRHGDMYEKAELVFKEV